MTKHEHEDLFNLWHGDVVIFPENTDWLITFTLEEEWLGGSPSGLPKLMDIE